MQMNGGGRFGTRRKFLLDASVSLIGLCSLSNTPRLLARDSGTLLEGPYFDLANDQLTNMDGKDLRFGTSIYPFRPAHPVQWILSECRALGLNGIRFAFPREHIDHAAEGSDFDPANYKNTHPEVTEAIRAAGLDVILTLQGHAGDSHGRPIDWPRNPDKSIDGKVAGRSFANYCRWLANHSKDFVSTFELWNEAFGHIDDSRFKMSFGPGGSKQNADNYSQMMLPAAAEIREHAVNAQLAVEGNYWNVEQSAGRSAGMQTLIGMADFMIHHPYSYNPGMYRSQADAENKAYFAATHRFFRQINPRIRHWYSEFNVGAKQLGFTQESMPPSVQAKAVLRATALHLRHGITHLDIFALYYPGSPSFSLIDNTRQRTPAFFAYRNLLAACQAGKVSAGGSLTRSSPLPDSIRDMAIATPRGYAYLIWQETPVAEFRNSTAPLPVNVTLSSSLGRPLRLRAALDPISGKPIADCQAESRQHTLTLSCSVPDYPIIMLLNV